MKIKINNIFSDFENQGQGITSVIRSDEANIKALVVTNTVIPHCHKMQILCIQIQILFSSCTHT